MKKYLVLLLIPCQLFAKDVRIIGPITAPWVKGQLCTSYWYDQKKTKQYFDVGAGKEYAVKNIPKRINRLKVTRSLDKTCKVKNNKKKCRVVKGNFYIKDPEHNTLDLTYDNVNITLNYTIPPKQPNSYFGVPRKDPALARTRLTIINGGDAFA